MKPGTSEKDYLPFGKRKGQMIVDQPTAYLLWALSQDGLRWKYPNFLRVALAEIAKRCAEPDKLIAELSMREPPPKRYVTKKDRNQKFFAHLAGQAIKKNRLNHPASQEVRKTKYAETPQRKFMTPFDSKQQRITELREELARRERSRLMEEAHENGIGDLI